MSSEISDIVIYSSDSKKINYDNIKGVCQVFYVSSVITYSKKLRRLRNLYSGKPMHVILEILR